MLEDEINKLTERENYDFNELKAEFFEPFNKDVFERMTDYKSYKKARKIR